MPEPTRRASLLIVAWPITGLVVADTPAFRLRVLLDHPFSFHQCKARTVREICPSWPTCIYQAIGRSGRSSNRMRALRSAAGRSPPAASPSRPVPVHKDMPFSCVCLSGAYCALGLKRSNSLGSRFTMCAASRSKRFQVTSSCCRTLASRRGVPAVLPPAPRFSPFLPSSK